MKKIIIFSALLIFSLYAENKQWEYCSLKNVKISKYTASSLRKIVFDKEYNKEEQKKIKQKINEDKMLDVHVFNILGKRGWELVTRYSFGEGFSTIYYIFKRPRK